MLSHMMLLDNLQDLRPDKHQNLASPCDLHSETVCMLSANLTPWLPRHSPASIARVPQKDSIDPVAAAAAACRARRETRRVLSSHTARQECMSTALLEPEQRLLAA